MNIDLVTFTWPDPHPLQVLPMRFFEISPARWKEFVSTWPANLLKNAVEGISPGQVNVTSFITMDHGNSSWERPANNKK